MTTMPAFTMMDVPTEMANSEQQFWRSTYWDAVTGRERAMDGVFFYAVRTTGVYCRPSCPSRRPKPENVVFFRTRSGAERAGFRPCKRCKPERDIQTDANSEIVEKVCRYIDTHPDQPATLEKLSGAIGLSPFHLHRTFKALTGITPRAYADSRRLESLKAGLREGHSVTRSLYDAVALPQARLRSDDSVLHRGNTRRSAAARGHGSRCLFDPVRGLRHYARRRAPQRISPGGHRSQRQAAYQLGPRCSESHPWRKHCLAAVGYSSHGIPAFGVGAASRHPERSYAILQRDCQADRKAASRPSRGACLRYQSCCGRNSVPSRGSGRRRVGRLSFGYPAQAQAPGLGEEGLSFQIRLRPAAHPVSRRRRGRRKDYEPAF